MRFAFDSDQRELAASVRQVLDGELSADVRERACTEPVIRRGELWGHLADLGVFGLLVDEKHGGLGLTEVESVLVLEELGRGAALGPVAETFFIAAPLLARGPDAGAAWLPGLSTGELTVSVGAEFFPDGDVADLLVVVGEGRVDLVDRTAAELVQQSCLDRTRASVSLAEPAPAQELESAEPGGQLAQHARDRGALSAAAQLIGAARHVLDVTVDYAAQRKQFGRAIGSYQAVQHHLADVLVQLEFARPLVYRAAYTMARRQDSASADASMAKMAAADAADLAARTALQVHGAIGYTEELDLQVWLKRIWSLVPVWGDAATHRRRVADVLLTVPANR